MTEDTTSNLIFPYSSWQVLCYPSQPLSYKLKNSEGDDENQDSDLMMSKLCIEPSHNMILSVLY